MPQARYWSARSRELEGAKADVVGPAYEALITSAPASFYALMAVERLKELGRTICVVEHSLHVVEKLADHVVFMEEGRVTAEGTIEELTSQQRLVEVYFGT